MGLILWSAGAEAGARAEETANRSILMNNTDFYVYRILNPSIFLVINAYTKESIVRKPLTQILKGLSHDKPLYTCACDCRYHRRIEDY